MGLAEVDHRAALEQQRAVAEAVQRTHVVGYEHDRAPLVAHAVEDVEALLREGGVADREHLVDEQDVGVDLDRDREGQPHVHARGVVLELQLLELAQFGEVDHRVVARRRASRGERPIMIPLSTTLSRAARSWLKPTPSSMKVDRRPFIQIWPLSTP